MINLSIEIAGVKLKNPIIAASGPVTNSLSNIKRCVDAGIGALCLKTSTYSEEMQRYPYPMFTLRDFETRKSDPWYIPPYFALYSRDHLADLPPEKWVEKVAKPACRYAHEKDCKIIGCAGGATIGERIKNAEMHQDAGCDILEGVGVTACPNGPPEEVERIMATYLEDYENSVEAVKESVDIPIISNLNSWTPVDPLNVALIARRAGADGVTAIKRERALRINIETGKPLNYGYCTSSGHGTLEFTVRIISEIRWNVPDKRFAILATKGPVTWRDAIECMMAGATAVEYCTAIMTFGVGHIKYLVNGIEKFLKRKGYNSPREIVGMALPHLEEAHDIPKKHKPLIAVVDPDLCVGCSRCQVVCWYGAITIHKKAVIDRSRCVGCTLCQWVCPFHAITTKEIGTKEEYLTALEHNATR